MMNSELLNRKEAMAKMNYMGLNGIPFLFYTNWKGSQTKILPLTDTEGVHFSFNGMNNLTSDGGSNNQAAFEMQVEPIPYSIYSSGYNEIQYYLSHGDSYLVNLTYPSKITCNIELQDIYNISDAPYKIYVPDEFLVFSPERFIQIKDGIITTHPMKGTIQASIPNAQNILLADQKESAEHSTIVDLMRNDLSMVSNNVRVSRFKYLEYINSFSDPLYQMSSEITGILAHDPLSKLGDILYRLLPAGSISGAPKKRTIEIIEQVEMDDRSWYTGICGIFDGYNFDTAVMIRYIEKNESGLVFRSGGGITAQSDLSKEYEELKSKIYVPISGDHTDQARNHHKFKVAQPTSESHAPAIF